MTTDEQYRDIANEVYAVDPSWPDHPQVKKGDEFYAGSGDREQLYHVIDSQNNPTTGFQGMAVVPIVKGKPDMSQITVSFAGTNPGELNDLAADAGE